MTNLNICNGKMWKKMIEMTFSRIWCMMWEVLTQKILFSNILILKEKRRTQQKVLSSKTWRKSLRTRTILSNKNPNQQQLIKLNNPQFLFNSRPKNNLKLQSLLVRKLIRNKARLQVLNQINLSQWLLLLKRMKNDWMRQKS